MRANIIIFKSANTYHNIDIHILVFMIQQIILQVVMFIWDHHVNS